MMIMHAVSKKMHLPKNKGILQQLGEIIRVLGIALLLRYFVVSAHVIPSGSMEQTLQVGDFLISLPWLYGVTIPYTNIRLPGVSKVKQGDVIIFRAACDPSEDYIKRCVATAGQTVSIIHKQLLVDQAPLQGHFSIQHTDPTVYPQEMVARDNFGPLYLPRAGDSLSVPATDTPGEMSFDMVALLALQEHTNMINTDPFFIVNRLVKKQDMTKIITVHKQLFLDGTLISELKGPVHYPSFTAFKRNVQSAQHHYPNALLQVTQKLYLHGQQIHTYHVLHDTYFAMGDNRDNSLDSRYWGVVSERVITASPLIIFWSWESKKSTLQQHETFNPLVRIKDVAWTILTNIHNGGLLTRPRWRRIFRLI